MGYVTRSFDLTREFLYEWTVNWRFISEENFTSPIFSVNLLILHAVLVGAFLFSRWIRPSGEDFDSFARKFLAGRSKRFSLSSKYVATTILSSMIIGMACARSLHYQFYAYLAWATPLLLWQAQAHPALIYAIWGAQEYGWNVFPSTKTSSLAVVTCMALQIMVLLSNDNALYGPKEEEKTEAEEQKTK